MKTRYRNYTSYTLLSTLIAFSESIEQNRSRTKRFVLNDKYMQICPFNMSLNLKVIKLDLS